MVAGVLNRGKEIENLFLHRDWWMMMMMNLLSLLNQVVLCKNVVTICGQKGSASFWGCYIATFEERNKEKRKQGCRVKAFQCRVNEWGKDELSKLRGSSGSVAVVVVAKGVLNMLSDSSQRVLLESRKFEHLLEPAHLCQLCSSLCFLWPKLVWWFDRSCFSCFCWLGCLCRLLVLDGCQDIVEIGKVGRQLSAFLFLQLLFGLVGMIEFWRE